MPVPSGIAATQGRLTGMRAPGDFSFNPLGFEVTQNLAHKEIANGRLAMIGAMGFSAHYMIDGSVPFVFGNY